jgi:hypothetical protein
MTSPKHARETDEAQYTVLRKLDDIGQHMNLLEIGFSATPQLVRNMAARGMVRVTVEITSRGRDHLAAVRARKLRQKTQTDKVKRVSA